MAKGYPDYRYFSFPVSVNEGGTGVGALTLYGVLLGNGTSQIIPTAAGNPYEVLRVPALGGFPAFGALDLSQAAATVNQLPIAKGGTGTATPALVAGTGIQITGTWPNHTITNTSPASALGDPVTIAHGGTGTATAFTAGSVVFAVAAGTYSQDNANLFWDNANKRLGLGTPAPGTQLHILSDDGIIKLGTGVFPGKAGTTDTGLELGGAGRLTSGIFTEVDGAILSFGINVSQSGNRNNTYAGGLYRLDTRAGAEAFAVLGYPAGGASVYTFLTINLNTGQATFVDTTRNRALLAHTGWGGIFYSPTGACEVDVASDTYGLIVKSGNVGIGTDAPGKQLDVTGDVRVSVQLISTVATGTAPLAVTSTTKVANLNAERVADTQVTNAATAGLVLIGSGAGTAAWGTPDGCRVYNSAAQTIPNASATILTYDSERYDNGGLHSTSSNTGRLTAVKAGKYFIVSNTTWTANGTGYRLNSIYHSVDGVIAEGMLPASSLKGQSMSISSVYHLAASEYVFVTAEQNSTGNLDISGTPGPGAEFSMQWLGP